MNSAVTDVPSGAASKIGDVPLQARRVLAQAFRTRSTVFMPPESRINRLRLTAAFPATALSPSATCSPSRAGSAWPGQLGTLVST